MTTPATREEVVELMARDRWERQRDERREVGWPDLAPALQRACRRGVSADLTALEQSGIVLVPAEATEEMYDAMTPPIGEMSLRQWWSKTIAASPYKKETGNG